MDTMAALIAETRRTGKRLHYEHDAHPTPAGHAVIARAVAEFLEQENLVLVLSGLGSTSGS